MIQNLIEARVRDSYQALAGRFPSFCGCETCRDDVLVYALNRVPPRYVTTAAGQTVSDVALGGLQDRTMIDVAVLDGIRRVGEAPRCGRKAATTG